MYFLQLEKRWLESTLFGACNVLVHRWLWLQQNVGQDYTESWGNLSPSSQKEKKKRRNNLEVNLNKKLALGEVSKEKG